MADKTCRNCGDRIVRADFLGREAWTHQPAGASFQDGQHRYCHKTTAQPSCCGHGMWLHDADGCTGRLLRVDETGSISCPCTEPGGSES